MKNLVLIGMPGAGKTTVGRLLSRALDMELVDTDALIVAAAGMPISALFAQHGEPYFRDLEQRTVEAAAARTGVVLATGGGVVLRPQNMSALRRGGLVFFLDRPPASIAGGEHTARPLIGTERARIFDLYDRRIALYRKYADVIVSNPVSAEQAAAEILEHWREP